MASRSVPSTSTEPSAGCTNPDSTLKNVVLPAPLGPMSPQIPSGNCTVIWSSEITPPNRTLRPATSITTVRLGRRSRLEPLLLRRFGRLDEVDHQPDAEQRQAEAGPERVPDHVLGEELEQRRGEERCQQPAPQALDAAHD